MFKKGSQLKEKAEKIIQAVEGCPARQQGLALTPFGPATTGSASCKERKPGGLPCVARLRDLEEGEKEAIKNIEGNLQEFCPRVKEILG